MALRRIYWSPAVLRGALVAAALLCVQRAAADPCRPARLEAAGQAAANARLELELADGRLLQLAGVESPLARGALSDVTAEAAQDLALWASGAVSIFVLRSQPDRWGRQLARAFLDVAPAGATGEAHAALPSFSESIVEAGLARVDPATEIRPCLDRLYALEQRARTAGRGLWADPAYSVLIVGGGGDFKGRAGAMAIVEGRVASVRGGRGATFVNFGAGAPADPAAMIGREAARAMARGGTKPETLAGRIIRVRGVLDLRAGPRIEVLAPGAIELLSGPAKEP